MFPSLIFILQHGIILHWSLCHCSDFMLGRVPDLLSLLTCSQDGNHAGDSVPHQPASQLWTWHIPPLPVVLTVCIDHMFWRIGKLLGLLWSFLHQRSGCLGADWRRSSGWRHSSQQSLSFVSSCHFNSRPWLDVKRIQFRHLVSWDCKIVSISLVFEVSVSMYSNLIS